MMVMVVAVSMIVPAMSMVVLGVDSRAPEQRQSQHNNQIPYPKS